MAKKQAKQQTEKSAADYYRLHTQAVEDLASADVSNSPKVSEEELRKYRSGLAKYKFSDWVKIIFIKFWFPGSVCYFMIWGLGTYVSSMLDLLFITGIAMGVVTDLLTNNLLRYFADTDGGNDGLMLFPKRRYITFVFNIIYAWVILFFVFTIYGIINGAIALASGSGNAATIGVEPILFGVFYAGVDLLIVGARNLLKRIIKDAKERT